MKKIGIYLFAVYFMNIYDMLPITLRTQGLNSSPHFSFIQCHFDQTSEMWTPWDQGKNLPFGQLHLCGLLSLYQVKMGLGNRVYNMWGVHISEVFTITGFTVSTNQIFRKHPIKNLPSVEEIDNKVLRRNLSVFSFYTGVPAEDVIHMSLTNKASHHTVWIWKTLKWCW